MGHGFIHDKLEIKFLILYITARVIEPIPFEVVLDLTLCDDAIDYFDFSECLNDLVKTGHLTLSEDGLYAITEKGLKNSQICESSLPYSAPLRQKPRRLQPPPPAEKPGPVLLPEARERHLYRPLLPLG